jgi:predicted  nucleic acid-binding Zn-ribbon protein
MAPVGKYYKPDGEEVLVHKCLECGDIKYNRVAGDDSFEKMAQLPVVERL